MPNPDPAARAEKLDDGAALYTAAKAVLEAWREGSVVAASNPGYQMFCSTLAMLRMAVSDRERGLDR